MKICVFSDSHGREGKMADAIAFEQPDACFFLGDGERDLAVIEECFPKLKIYAVSGNCDFVSMLKSSRCCEIEGVTIYATHGHLSRVKYEAELDTLTSQAQEAGADVALFGHTHRQHLSYNRGIMLLNPGTVHYGEYAVLTIENGRCTAELTSN